MHVCMYVWRCMASRAQPCFACVHACPCTRAWHPVSACMCSIVLGAHVNTAAGQCAATVHVHMDGRVTVTGTLRACSVQLLPSVWPGGRPAQRAVHACFSLLPKPSRQPFTLSSVSQRVGPIQPANEGTRGGYTHQRYRRSLRGHNGWLHTRLKYVLTSWETRRLSNRPWGGHACHSTTHCMPGVSSTQSQRPVCFTI